MIDKDFIPEMLKKGKEASLKVIKELDSLSEEQLNWKPSEDKWSIAQCLDHLIVSDSQFFPVFKKLCEQKYQMTWWENKSPFTGFWGRTMIRQISETVRRKLKAPRILKPSSSNIEGDIVLKYNTNLDHFLGLIAGCHNLDLDKIIITSPVTKIITYSLRHAITFLMQHEHRHINQAIRVKQNERFPA